MRAKDTFFAKKSTINCGGNLLTLDSPLIMGILNLTADSFFDGGKYQSVEQALSQTEKMLTEGVDIIDIGAASTKPGSELIDPAKEWEMIKPVLTAILQKFPEIIVSVDTYNSFTAEQSIKHGAHIINDISGGNFDKNMFKTIAALKVPYILMHLKGEPKNMQENPQYQNVVTEVMDFFTEKINELKALGVNDIILDPGFGFGKTLNHNYELLNNLNLFEIFELPILVGLSRKSMISKVLNISSKDALNGTSILNTIALMNGANILRVHDVKEAKQCVELIKFAQSVKN